MDQKNMKNPLIELGETNPIKKDDPGYYIWSNTDFAIINIIARNISQNVDDIVLREIHNKINRPIWNEMWITTTDQLISDYNGKNL